jgi:hypothetical protein
MEEVELLVQTVAAAWYLNILAEVIEECRPQQIKIVSETRLC